MPAWQCVPPRGTKGGPYLYYKMPNTPRRNSVHKSSPKRRLTSPVKHRQPNWLIRYLQHVPGKAWWVGGFLIAAAYIWFFYYFFVGPYGFRWRALYGDISHPEGYEIHGIDISHHQGSIQWDTLAERATINDYPISFVVMKATEGATIVDENFHDYFRKAKLKGFIRGVYHFWSTKSGATQQAQFFMKNVRLEEGDLPPVLDVEHRAADQTPEAFRDSVRRWLYLVERHYKVKPIIYTYYKFKTQYLSGQPFDDYPYWIAHYYVDKVEYAGAWKFWQYTDAGRLPGIKGLVDLDIYNGSYYDLQQQCIRRESDE